jgi:PTS system N-acetylgalactosamine-specific IIC component
MEISLLQALALGILAFIAGLDMFNGLTHMHRPVVLGPLVGLILGDLHTGILTGGTLELVWMGLAPLAGAQPPNVIIGTIVGTAFAISTGVKPEVAVGVAVPFAVAVQMGITFLFSVMSGVMSAAIAWRPMPTPTVLNGLTIWRCWRSASSTFCALSCRSTSVRNMRKPPLMFCRNV